MNRLEVLVGPIGSGKSTYARRRADEGALVVAHDALTQMLHGGAYRYEAGLRETYRRMEEDLARRALAAGRDVVIDRTHLTAESRARWVNLARDVGVPALAVAFPDDGPEASARRRSLTDARGRTHDEWLAVARHHAGQSAAEPLDGEAEGFGAVRREGGNHNDTV